MLIQANIAIYGPYDRVLRVKFTFWASWKLRNKETSPPKPTMSFKTVIMSQDIQFPLKNLVLKVTYNNLEYYNQTHTKSVICINKAN